MFAPEKKTRYAFNSSSIVLVLYLPINIEIEKSFERRSSLSNEDEADEQYSEDEELKDDFFSKYITADNATRRDFKDNSSTFVISEKSAYKSVSGQFDFTRKSRAKTSFA